MPAVSQTVLFLAGPLVAISEVMMMVMDEFAGESARAAIETTCSMVTGSSFSQAVFDVCALLR